MSVLGTKSERPDLDDLDMCRGGLVIILVEVAARQEVKRRAKEELYGCATRHKRT